MTISMTQQQKLCAIWDNVKVNSKDLKLTDKILP